MIFNVKSQCLAIFLPHTRRCVGAASFSLPVSATWVSERAVQQWPTLRGKHWQGELPATLPCILRAVANYFSKRTPPHKG